MRTPLTEHDLTMLLRNGARVIQDHGAAPLFVHQARQPAEAETPFLGRVLALARQHGWAAYHTHDSRKSAPGFPDVVLVREGVLWRELKTNTGKLTQEQATWLSLLCHAGQDADVWRPRDWDAIVARLTQPQKGQTDEARNP